ncbi:MAG: aminoacyl-histidine dipeptidase [Defluviitaleaceae bacterium]|nr:aminoacyl-histidine dipeptidase [Defluviitaleaceae bacterium]
MNHIVLKQFLEISKIPRGSGNEKSVSDFVADFGRKRGADVAQDEWHNLIIKKAASAGYESKPPIILQAHLDMVCEKNADTQHDFLNDPIDIYVDGDFIKARGTTLGADNGIGVALCMAFLDGEFKHPPLEIVLTSEEETGMSGAENLDISLLSGKRMINLDSSDETTFTMGCAAGTTSEFIIPLEWASHEGTSYEISVKGLKGGHSGGDIEKERANALRILAFILDELEKNADVSIAEISGGMKVNAIPREAVASIYIPESMTTEAERIIENCKENFSNQFRVSDSGLKINFTKKKAKKFLTKNCTRKIISALLLIPNGAISMSLEIENLPNASCNIGVAETTNEHIKISSMPRGAAEYYTRQIEAQISTLALHLGANVNFVQRSPAWPYNPDSRLLKSAIETYLRSYKTEPIATAVHGGLECGIFIAKFLEKGTLLDIISFGPNSYDYHTPDEKLSISSVERVWEFLKNLLEEL